MKSTGVLVGLVVALLVVSIGCRVLLAAEIQKPRTVVARVQGEGAPVSEERAQVKAVVEEFLKAVRAKNWPKAASLFDSQWQADHKQELLTGQPFSYNRKGKSIQSILFFHGTKISRITIKKSRAWARLITGEDKSAQQGSFILELGLQKSGWVILRFPPSPNAVQDARNAMTKEEVDSERVTEMLQDGKLSAHEEQELKKVLPAYYGMAVEFERRAKERSSSSTSYRKATLEEIKRIGKSLDQQPELTVKSIVLWREATPKAREKSEELAEKAIKNIYAKLEAAKDKYPELAKFDEQHVKLSLRNYGSSSLQYRPIPLKDRDKVGPSDILVGIVPAECCLVTTQLAFPSYLFLPRQKIAISHLLTTKDKALRQFIIKSITEGAQNLIKYEQSLGGEPAYENWEH